MFAPTARKRSNTMTSMTSNALIVGYISLLHRIVTMKMLKKINTQYYG